MCKFTLTEADVPYVVGFNLKADEEEMVIHPEDAPVPWSCPHSPADGDYCTFHQGWVNDVPPEEEIRAHLLETLADPDKPNRFVGLRCDELNIEDVNIEIAGKPRQIRLEHTFVSDSLSINSAQIPTSINFSFAQCAQFEFVESTLGGDLLANHSNFGPTVLNESTIEGEFECSSAWIGVEVFSARDLTVRGDTSFLNTNFGYPEGRITSEVIFSQVRITGELSFYETRFGNDVHLSDAKMENLSLSQSTIYDIFDAEGLQTDEIHLGYTYSLGETDKLDFTDAKVEEGVIRPNDPSLTHHSVDLSEEYDDIQPVWVDFTEALLGDLEVYDSKSEYSLKNVRFRESKFNGFSWMKYRSYFSEQGFEIHSLRDEFSADPTTDPGRLETTYLRAKNSANDMGESTVAAEFFRKQMRYRRQLYTTRLREDSLLGRIRAAGAYLSNLALDLTTGYGERPSYVAVNVCVWIVFGALSLNYLNALPDQASVVDYLVLSTQSFVTFIIGTPLTNNSLSIRVVTTVLALLGAFYIALAVFTLTRSVDR